MNNLPKIHILEVKNYAKIAQSESEGQGKGKLERKISIMKFLALLSKNGKRYLNILFI